MAEPTPQDDDNAGYSLVMPYVVCRSNGGPYDDEAFVAGATTADVGHALEAGPAEHHMPVPPALLPQLDLVAMHHGYQMASVPWDEHPDEWALVSFTRSADVEAGDG